MDLLMTVGIVLLVLWLLGLVTSYTLGGFIHILLVLCSSFASFRGAAPFPELQCASPDRGFQPARSSGLRSNAPSNFSPYRDF
jgi:Family of unknown function (DUF5670)